VLEADESAWRDVDRILLSTEPFAFREGDRRTLQQQTGRPVALLDGEWTSWYGPRAAPGLRALARCFYCGRSGKPLPRI